MSWVEVQTGGSGGGIAELFFLPIFIIVLLVHVTLELERCVCYIQPGLKQ